MQIYEKFLNNDRVSVLLLNVPPVTNTSNPVAPVVNPVTLNVPPVLLVNVAVPVKLS